MKISTKGRYALRMMLDIAAQGEGTIVPLKDIAERQGISVKYQEQIVLLLSKSGFLKSVRGPRGGYRLTRSPEEYSVGDILRVTEGTLAPVACLDESENQCNRCNHCETLEFWEGLDIVINDYVNKFTLADLMEKH
jgi:Rrf2 family protein